MLVRKNRLRGTITLKLDKIRQYLYWFKRMVGVALLFFADAGFCGKMLGR